MSKKNKTLIIRVLLFGGTFISLFFVPWLLLKAWILPLPSTVKGQLDEAVSHGFDGVISYVQRGDDLPQLSASGWHDKKASIPAKSSALFKIASISKLYDAVAVTKLVSAGKLSLDKTIEDYLPDIAGSIENSDKITLLQMLQHRSGIPNFTDAPNYWATPSQSFSKSLTLIANQPALFEPGEAYEYCNTNYLLINKIMDETIGYDNFEFIKENILKPLKLKHTFGSITEVDLDSVMSGYHVGHDFDLKEEERGMLASVTDVGVFIRALNDGSVFDLAEKDLYQSIYKYEHSGWVPGYQSFASYDKEADAVFVTFYNTTDPKLYNWNLSEIINNRIVSIVKQR